MTHGLSSTLFPKENTRKTTPSQIATRSLSQGPRQNRFSVDPRTDPYPTLCLTQHPLPDAKTKLSYTQHSTVVKCELTSRRAQLQHQFIGVAPTPALPGLSRANDWVLGGIVVGGCMTPRRAVATADVPTCLAHAQMHPPPACGQALLAASHILGQIEDLHRI
jgi:hypothetical protein